ncbi:MAG: SDR family oxidoreductase [Xanthobacteraceae bacterium]|nr:SDR family oxidoreductase [Xanthobacteraceae bacterium]
MDYFVTGASGFIGKRLVRTLLARRDARIYFLIRNPSAERLAKLFRFWGSDEARTIPVEGDLTKPDLGIAPADREKLPQVDHVFHLGAIYDLDADPAAEMRTNIEGTRNVVAFATVIGAGRFHHMSSIAAAGLYHGVFREDMFEEAENLEHPYFASKHESERVVRSECRIPWRVYRPGLVVGDSRTGEMDKIDGPYYFFKLIQKLRRLLPPWMPSIGIEGGRINLVPVDFVVAALDHLAHLDGHDGACFHLTDPHPHRVGDILNIFCRAAHAPEMAIRVNAALFDFIPAGLLKGLMALTPTRRVRKAVMKDLGLPNDIFTFVNYPTRFDGRDAERLLAAAGITVPRLEDYAWRLWDYWERHLDPDLFIDRSLKGRVEGRVVLITGGSSGIGKAAAFRIAEAGATTLIVARDAEKLARTREEAAARGLKLVTYAGDLADPAQCAALIDRIKCDHGAVDILVNNAGRSIRRGIENAYDRFHDFERMMRVNYFGALQLTLGLLPEMARRRSGHVIVISSIGVLTNAPRFSAYVASKAALEAWTRCAASEFLDRGVEFTTINMPLVRTPMSAPTRIYDSAPMLTPDEAAEFIIEAIVKRPERIATKLGIFGQVLHSLLPHVAQVIENTTFRMFPDSAAALGQKPESERESASPDQVAYTQLMRGIHF